MSHDMKSIERRAQALQPLVKRVRTDVTAMKMPDGSSRWVREALTDERLLKHLNGGPARGVCPIREGESVTMVGLFDLDSHGGETPWDGMTAVARQLMDLLELDGNAPVAFRSSGGKGIHVYLLWDEPQDAYSVRAYMTDVLTCLGYGNGAKGVSRGQIEVFPKQDRVGAGEFGNQFILPLAGHSEPLDPLFDLEPMGKDWISQVEWSGSPSVERRERAAVSVQGGADAAPAAISRVRQALFAIPNTEDDCPDYDRWRDLAFAVHEATGGSDEGMALFTEWSAQNAKHDEKFLEKRVWPYIKDRRSSGREITRDTLFYEAAGAGWVDTVGIDADGFEDVSVEDMTPDPAEAEARAVAKYEAKAEWKHAIEAAIDERTLREQVCSKIALDRTLDSIDRELLAEAVKVRFAAIGAKLPIAACRKLVAPARQRQESPDLPSWCADWVYVTDHDKFFRQDSDEWLSMQAFNARFNRYVVPANAEDDGSFNAAWFVLNQCGMNTVTRAIYLPWAEPVFELDGVQCVNKFRPSSMPAAAPAFTPDGRAAIELVKKHLSMLVGGRTEVLDVLLSWMAYNAQNPGRKIRWAPLIKGVEGDGKTLIGRVMAAVIGPSNVKDISPKVLGTDFTAWAAGACVGVLEEIRLAGHNRHDILNALKPYITNNSVAIHAKGSDEYNTINTMNYIAFTNHSDALPLSDSDRRWFIVFTPFLTTADLQAAVGDVGAYFDALYDAIEQHRGELRKWLLEHRIAEGFNPNGMAPMTNEKKSMIAMAVSPEEEAVREAIEAGGPGIGANVLSTAYLSRVIREIDPEVELKTSALARVLAKLGWEKVAKQVKWAGAPQRVWVLGRADRGNDLIRAELDATLVTAGLDDDKF